jgi:hypothetical protein
VDGPDGSSQGRAIATARLAGIRLVLAGPVQPGQEDYFRSEIALHLDGDMVRFVGEVGGTRRKGAVRAREGVRDADPLGGAVWDGDGRGARMRHAGDRVLRGSGERDRDRRTERRPRRRRASDGRRDRLARCDRPARLPRKRRLALRHRDRRRRLRNCLPSRGGSPRASCAPAARGARGAAGIAGG